MNTSPRTTTSLAAASSTDGAATGGHPHTGPSVLQRSAERSFALQRIVGMTGQEFACEALFRSGSEGHACPDSDTASQIMLDNWLLHGFEQLTPRNTIFLNCTRDTLMSGLLTLLPRSAVFEILESVEPDDELVAMCRSLKAAGYRIALDDFTSLHQMEGFLDLADFIKVDFRQSGRRERACLLRRLHLTNARLIAEKIESEDEFNLAVGEGFELFQGHYIGEAVTYTRSDEPIDLAICRRIIEVIESSDRTRDQLHDLIQSDAGLERRVLRKANWSASRRSEIGSTRYALSIIDGWELRKIVTLAMHACLASNGSHRSVAAIRNSMRSQMEAVGRWVDKTSADAVEAVSWSNRFQTMSV